MDGGGKSKPSILSDVEKIIQSGDLRKRLCDNKSAKENISLEIGISDR